MDNEEQTHQLLVEIRDIQRQHLAEYKRIAARLLELQEAAVARQLYIVQVQRRILPFAGALIAMLLALLIYLLVKHGHQVFGS